MKSFKFLTNKKSELRPHGIMKGFIDLVLSYDNILSYSYRNCESEVIFKSYNDFQLLKSNNPNLDIRFCAIYIEEKRRGNQVVTYFYDNVLNNDNMIPHQFYMNPDKGFFIEILKLPR